MKIQLSKAELFGILETLDKKANTYAGHIQKLNRQHEALIETVQVLEEIAAKLMDIHRNSETNKQ